MRGRKRKAIRSEEFMRFAMDRWGASVYRLALVRLATKQDAEDVYQDVYLRLACDGTAFASDEHLKAWLLRVTLNRCREVARIARRRPNVITDVDMARSKVSASATTYPSGDAEAPYGTHRMQANTAADPEASVLAEEQAQQIRDAVGDLPPKYRELVHLFYQEGLGCEEISEITGTRPSTVRTRLQRARERLREKLQEPERSERGSS